MNKKIALLLAAVTVIAAVSGCGKAKDGVVADDGSIVNNYASGSSDNVDMDKIDGEELGEAEDNEDTSAALKESSVSIENAKVVDAGESGKILIVSFKFTNGSGSEESFSSMIDAEAYQDGAELTPAIVRDPIEGFDPNSTAERIKKGKTINVQKAYRLDSDAGVITVSAREYNSTAEDKAAVKTFNLQ